MLKGLWAPTYILHHRKVSQVLNFDLGDVSELDGDGDFFDDTDSSSDGGCGGASGIRCRVWWWWWWW